MKYPATITSGEFEEFVASIQTAHSVERGIAMEAAYGFLADQNVVVTDRPMQLFADLMGELLAN